MVVIYNGHVEVTVDTLNGVAFVTHILVCSLRVYHIYPNVAIANLILKEDAT